MLIVDDSPLICSLIKEAIAGHSDYDCQSVFTAQEALDKLHDYQPNLLVVDVNLPSSSGFDLVRQLREDRLWLATPIIMLAEKDKDASQRMLLAYECGADDIIPKPFDPVELVLKIKSIFRRISFTYREAATTLEKKTIHALGRSVEVKDTYTEGHSARVAFYSVLITKAMFLAEDKVSAIEDAAYLHDIGKIGIHEGILNKAGPLTDEEWQIMRTHPEKSAVIVESLGFTSEMVPMVKHHHERYDGKGYTEGLRGENIPIGARVISVADSFDAMTSNRAFREKRDITYALSEFTKNSGTQFDPQVAEIFTMEIKKFPGIEELPSYTSAESFELLKLVRR